MSSLLKRYTLLFAGIFFISHCANKFSLPSKSVGEWFDKNNDKYFYNSAHDCLGQIERLGTDAGVVTTDKGYTSVIFSMSPYITYTSLNDEEGFFAAEGRTDLPAFQEDLYLEKDPSENPFYIRKNNKLFKKHFMPVFFPLVVKPDVTDFNPRRPDYSKVNRFVSYLSHSAYYQVEKDLKLVTQTPSLVASNEGTIISYSKKDIPVLKGSFIKVISEDTSTSEFYSRLKEITGLTPPEELGSNLKTRKVKDGIKNTYCPPFEDTEEYIEP